MTEFKHEWIEEARESLTEQGVERSICIPVQLEMLDEITRLQSRVQELDSVNQDMGLTISQMDYAYTIDKETMEKRIAELEAEQRWINAYERQPIKDGYYFVVCKKEYLGHVEPIADYFSVKHGWWNVSHFITHWQERPKPPKES
jgi:hypothetical protein